MGNILLEEINRMRKLMNLTEMDKIETEDNLNNDPLGKIIIQSLKKQLGGGKEMYIRLIDNRPGKNGKSNLVKQTVNGEIIDIEDDEPEPSDPVNEGIKDTLKIGAICYILASGAVSCKKDGYDISSDARYRLKPNILNSLGKEYFDSPIANKDKIYIMAGNQTGGGKGRERYLYHDYTTQTKSYGVVTDYADSAASGANGVSPVEVVEVKPFNSDIIAKLQPYNKTGINLGTLIGKYKNVVVVDVMPSSHYDWSDPYKPNEVKDTKYKTGHAIYLSNADGINVGEVYPTMLDFMFGTYKDPTNGNGKIMSLDDYSSGGFFNLLGDKPDL
jgi:hypothetical protein